jgi:uncharacterized membrane protein
MKKVKVLLVGESWMTISQHYKGFDHFTSATFGTGHAFLKEAAEDYESHPFNAFFRNNFRVFLSTDNRLMSNTTLSKEFEIAVDNYGLTLRDLEKITINAMKSAFIHHNEKLKIIFDVIKKGYADLRKEFGLSD